MVRALSRHPKLIAWSLSVLFYLDLILVPVGAKGESSIVRNHQRVPAPSWQSYFKSLQQHNASLPGADARHISNKIAVNADSAAGGGPTQPEMASFTSVNSNNMVDLFTGDFSYNIPLMDVGGYPINLAYRGGISMDQEASWVGLGWNINPGTITRNMRGLPDDFDGDTIKKVMHVRENKTIGVTAGADFELLGLPSAIGTSLGVFHNTYRGWGIEHALNASINAGNAAKGPFSGGLSFSNNSQGGLTITPSLSLRLWNTESENGSSGGSLTLSLPYNSRAGIKELQLSSGIRQSNRDGNNQKKSGNYGAGISSVISFVSPSFTPSISIPYTSTQFTFTGKLGGEVHVQHPNFFVSGYVSKQTIDDADTLLTLPAYGYLHFTEGAQNIGSLLDFNREKDLPYREKPATPHIAIPSYTYDAFSITGEGTGGMFRAYRGDIGFINDHFMRSKDNSDRLSVDLGGGDLSHGGIDININRAFTQTGPWINSNPIKRSINFRKDSAFFESVYFRNPGEKSINSKAFYEAVGGDDVVTIGLYQPDRTSSLIQTTNFLTRYRNKKIVGNLKLTPQTAIKPERDKRSQVITYITAKEADAGASLNKYIESYAVNQFDPTICGDANFENLEGEGTGLQALYFRNRYFKDIPYARVDPELNIVWSGAGPDIPIVPPFSTKFPNNQFSIRWEGRIVAPITGRYTFMLYSDDGVKFWMNDSLVLERYFDKPMDPRPEDSIHLNLVQGEAYKIKIEYYENQENAGIRFKWRYPGQEEEVVPVVALHPPPSKDTFALANVVKEQRVNKFRKENHISEIDVLNSDGRRYVYGIPVYNLKQKETTFSVDHFKGDAVSGLVAYKNDTDNTSKNHSGRDWFYSSEEIPAYAHSFLLTGILSADYSDITGNGISDDDIGDAVKFNYSKVCGIANPYKWRAPQVVGVATYNEGLKTDTMDDKGSYVYGEKELWYLHSIESKTMIATFELEHRDDLLSIDEFGRPVHDGAARRLKRINLYTKAEFMKKGTLATPVKTVNFSYNYQLCPNVYGMGTTGKLTLEKVWFTYNGNDKDTLNPYVFSYNANNPEYNIKDYDRWGNFKDPLQNPGSTQSNVITNAEYPYALQDSSTAATNAAAWMLDSIHLPSGGSMKIQYESDDYAFVQNKRAMQLFKIEGLGSTTTFSGTNQLYAKISDDLWNDYLYVYVKVPQTVTTAQDVYQKYLAGVEKLYFRLYVRMPDDQFGSGHEYVPVYANLSKVNSYGLLDSNTIWIKIDGISEKGDGPGTFSPLAKAAIQYLRLNLPSKAYPGSQNMEDLDLREAVEALASLGSNITNAFNSFDEIARNHIWATLIDTSRSFVRLNNPAYKKYGGGHRVKRITIYDNWDKMTQQRAATYGQEYAYTTAQEINGVSTTISSGVAVYEPMLGNEENPFRIPIEYVESVSALGPITLGYSEEPLGESFFPAAGVGYSCVRTRTIHYKNRKSANGYEETKFYTAYDFPIHTDRTIIDDDTKKRFHPPLADFLRINARHYVTLSQGFKIELNDMHGKLRSKATYSENDPKNFLTYSENIYRVDEGPPGNRRLSNTVMAIHPDGTIDTAALIGKDVEIMVDMREQLSVTNGNNVSLNADMFTVPFVPPLFVIPSFLNLAQREENKFRSAATVKIIQRYGILDSVIAIDKGSKVSTKDILYDAETGNVVLTRTQNEFNDYVYNFTYPSHWAYDGMGLAYKNINVTLKGIEFRDGRVIQPQSFVEADFFSSGDEILVAGQQKTGEGTGCNDEYSTFPHYDKIWAIDSSVLTGGSPMFYFVDRNGKPYSGYAITLKIIRSGRRNILGAVGTATTLESPLRFNADSQRYELKLDDTSKALAAGAVSFKQFWKVEDIKYPKRDTAIFDVNCPEGYTYDEMLNACIKDTSVVITDSFKVCESDNHADYSPCGTYIYYTFNIENTQFVRSQFDPSDTFWINHESSSCNLNPALVSDGGGQSFLKGIQFFNDSIQGFQQKSLLLSTDQTAGPLNRTGVWTCNRESVPLNTWFGFTVPINIPHSGRYYIGMAADNQIRVHIDGNLFREDQGSTDPENFKLWHIFPVYITKGLHSFKIEGRDFGVATGVGLEIYDNTEEELRAATSYDSLNLLFSTKDIIDKWYPSDYSCPVGYSLMEDSGSFFCRSIVPRPQDSIITETCQDIVADTASNPYVTGALGNWRSDRSYVYYARRAESDPSTASTDIRHFGTIENFAPYWVFEGNRLVPQEDTTRWVWNSEITLFNRKGYEIENKDPLGRYNAVLYGYNLTLPAAVTQNSRNRETAFEGFEDYDFVTQFCDTACQPSRHIDFRDFKSKIDVTVSHTGKSSLKLNASDSVALTFAVDSEANDNKTAAIQFHLVPDTCSPDGQVLEEVQVNNDILLPSFAPTPGKRMLLSVWVKEDQDCKCASYTSNRIVVAFPGSISGGYIFTPTGNIIEGWQRYESMFEIPVDATGVTVSMESTGEVAVWFDDLRMHPYNANMKSFVFHPVNLRLMAELDENNYATFYEYDDDGTLIRLKKETERGIKMIRETRSALLKEAKFQY